MALEHYPDVIILLVVVWLLSWT